MEELADLTVLHFTDAYHIEQRDKEPVGGSARIKTAIDNLSHLNPLLLHSGDLYSPSLMSSVFRGREMAAVLNELKPVCGVLGNHDLDYGPEEFIKLAEINKASPWLVSNVIDKTTGKPILGCLERLLLDWNGVKVGLMGIIEEDWIVTLSMDTSNFVYKDFVETATKMATELRELGAQFIIALSHMRVPNDQILAQKAKGIDLILGGHDHFYHYEVVNNVPIVKSGTDFRWLSKISVHLPKLTKDTKDMPAKIQVETIEITEQIPEDPKLKEMVAKFQAEVASKLSKTVAYTEVELDARAATVRTRESNLGNFIADVMRREYNADIAILNSGSIRSDDTYGPGPLTIKDLVNILPFDTDIIVVVALPGRDVRAALENGVSAYPSQEGRFPQVSGVCFSFDPSKPPGQRIVKVEVGGEPLDDNKIYTLATKPYMLEGRDGYECLKGHPFVVDLERGIYIVTALRNYFKKLGVVETWRKVATPGLMRAVDKFHKRKPGLERVIAPKVEGRITVVQQ